LLGVEAVTSGLTWVARKMNDLEVAERALSDQAERHRIERLQEIAALRQHAAEYKKFQDVAIAGQAAVAAMSDDQRQAYVDQLNSARTYYEYSLQALRAQEEMGESTIVQQEQLRQKLEQIQRALKTVSDEAIRVGEAMKLGIQSATLDALTLFTQLRGQGVETAEAIQQSLSTIDIKKPEGINQLGEMMAKLVITAQVNGDEIGQALGDPLSKLSTQELQQ